MSRVYFHSPSGEAELWGGERHWLGSFCGDLARGFFDVVHDHEKIGALCSGPGYLQYPGTQNLEKFWAWQKSALLSLTSSVSDDFMSWKGHRIPSWHLVLNTVCRTGSDAAILAARIHSQCEIHCYVEGPDREWLAGLVDAGLESGVFRNLAPYKAVHDWHEVTDFLRSRDDEPVILSYSVCEQFPDPDVIGYRAPEAMPGEEFQPSWCDDELWESLDQRGRLEYHEGEAWNRLADAERWELGLAWLRGLDDGRRLQPSDWRNVRFGCGLSILDITAADWEERLDKAFRITEKELNA